MRPHAFLIAMLFCLISCKGYESYQVVPTDNLSSMNGIWELKAVECGSERSVGWDDRMSRHPLNIRKKVNNGQTIDYIVDSAKCLQTSVGHIEPKGQFVFTHFGYQKYCSETCNTSVVKCGPLNSSELVRMAIKGDQMIVQHNDNAVCSQAGQSGPLTLKYRLLHWQI